MQKGLLDGKKSEEAGPVDAAMTKVMKILSTMCLLIAIYNIATLTYGKPLPPYTDHKAPGS